ncbi:hypothetical protein BSKO_00879 [Bryopsis sp. KO-2023]|nr:hypothetical protein BSKO_00879 [Bryopsis sp. KO-2023]
MVSLSKYAPNTVKLNVYDLSEQNNLLYWLGFGVFHTGVEIFGVEYAYGGHDYEASGVFATEPRKPPGPVEFRESVIMGETDLLPQEVRQLVVKMGKGYKGNRYHLLQMNCNHFASDLCKNLTGRRAPSWVNRLAGLAVLCHCLLPATWVPPLTTPSQSPDDAEILRGPRPDEHSTLLNAPRSDAYRGVDMISDEEVDVQVSQTSRRS